MKISSFYRFIVLNAIALKIVSSQDGNPAETFINPPTMGPDKDYSKNPIYSIGESILITWKTSYTSLGLGVQQQLNGNAFMHLASDVFGASSFEWTVTLSNPNYTFDVTPSNSIPGNVFYFWIRDEKSDQSFISHYFNISQATETASSASSTSANMPTSFVPLFDNSATSTTISSSSQTSDAPVRTTEAVLSSSSCRTTTSPATFTDPTPTPSNTSTTAASPSSGWTVAQQAGVGIGAGIAGLAAIAVSWIVWRKKRFARGSKFGKEVHEKSSSAIYENDAREVRQVPELDHNQAGPFYPQLRDCQQVEWI